MAATVFMRIDGVKMPTPATCPINEQDIDSPQSGRSESGDMHRERVRTKVLMIEPAWEHLTEAQAAQLHAALAPVFVSVTIMVPWGGTTTRKMYAGDLKWTPDFDRDGRPFWNLNVQMTEK